jgi:hypothetical protein
MTRKAKSKKEFILPIAFLKKNRFDYQLFSIILLKQFHNTIHFGFFCRMVMKKKLFLLQASLSLLLFASCKSDKKAMKNPELVRIDSLETAMKEAETKAPAEPDLNLAMHLAKAYQNYQAGHPDDSLSPRFLFRSGQLIENVFDDKGRALELYYNVYRKYPRSPYAPHALFMTGNLHHSIRDSANAVNMLNLFLNKYPDHELKKDAAYLIASFGAIPDTGAAAPIP